MKNYSDLFLDLMLDEKIESFSVVKRDAKYVYVQIHYSNPNKSPQVHRAFNDTSLPPTK